MKQAFQVLSVEALGGGFHANLAVRELQRYWFARTGRLPVPVPGKPGMNIVVCTAGSCPSIHADLARLAESLGPEAAVIRTFQNLLLVVGSDGPGVLFGAYRLCEHWGVWFHLHGDSMPDEPLEGCPVINEDRRPLFPVRGLHPFHNFPEGPDAWSPEAYRCHFAQMAKMGMNFVGFHTYTDPGRPFEPQVWIGLPEEVLPQGRVASAYPVENWHPQCGHWGYTPIDPRQLPLEADRLLADDAFPDHADADGARDIFERIGGRWADVFSFAGRRGMQTCLGLEIPLHLPPELKRRLLEAGIAPEARESRLRLWIGIFKRIADTHPLDLFWLYIPENWVWAQSIPVGEVEAVVAEVELASEALKASGGAFRLGVAGWTVGPRNDPLALERLLPAGIPVAALSPQVGHLPISPFFSKFQNRQTWAVPWMEDDPRLTVPQLWVGRTLRDAADAHAMGCGGLLGIHWRTRGLSPQVSALARSAWDQNEWNPEFGRRFSEEDFVAAAGGEGQVGGRQGEWPAPQSVGNLPGTLFETAAVGATFYRVEVPPGSYHVTCHLAEGRTAPGARRMSLVANGTVLLDKGDLAALHGQGTVVSLRSTALRIGEERLIEIFLRQVIGETFLNAIEIEGHTDGFNQFEGVPYLRRINCGGSRIADPSGDWEEGRISSGGHQGRPRALDCSEFYRQWACAEFGEMVGSEAARIFSRIDGTLPCITFMREGPGNCTSDESEWSEVAPLYEFVGELEALGSLPMGSGERDRFHYWTHHFAYFRAAARLRCAAARPANRAELESAWREVYTHLIEAARSPGDIGTIFSVEQQWRRKNLKEAFVELNEAFRGSPRIVVPVWPSNITAGGRFVLEAFVVGTVPREKLVLAIRDAASGAVSKYPMPRQGLSAYRKELPARELPPIFSYRIEAELNEPVTCPAAPLQRAATCIVEPIP